MKKTFYFVSNFKKLSFALLFSLNLSRKFESYNLQHCKKNCRKLVFCVFSEQLLPLIRAAGSSSTLRGPNALVASAISRSLINKTTSEK